VHFAESRGCTRAHEVAEKYRTDANTDYHNVTAELIFGKDFTKEQRKCAKTVSLGRAYFMGGVKLCKTLRLPTKMITKKNGQMQEVAGDEGQRILDQYDTAVPYLRELGDQYVAIAERDGLLRTLSGRVCHFPLWEPRFGKNKPLPYEQACLQYGARDIKRAHTYKALNKKIQGSAADMAKWSFLALCRAGKLPLVTMHDENGVSVRNNKEALEVAEIMRNCVKLRVPMKCDVDVSPISWGHAKPIVAEAGV
jgi:DNA polymerase I-like protein with 3'-5' exonuclease and polymerase domains